MIALFSLINQLSKLKILLSSYLFICNNIITLQTNNYSVHQMNNFPQKFKLFKTKKRIKSRKTSQNISNSCQQQTTQTSHFNLNQSSLQSLEKSISMADKIKQKPDPTFPRYSLVAFFNPYFEEKIIAKTESRGHHKYNSEEVRRLDLPQGYIEKIRNMKDTQCNSKLFLKLNFEEKHKNRKELFMKTIQNVQNIESGKLKDLIMRKYRKSRGSVSKVIESQLYIEGYKKNPESPEDYKDYMIRGSSIRGGSPLKVTRRRNISSRGSVLDNSYTTAIRPDKNSFRVLQPWQVVGVE